MHCNKLKILLVEDNITDQMNFEHFVKQQELPYDYTIASSFHEAREILITQKDFHVILLDQELGDGTGFDLFQYIPKDIPFIFITGAGNVNQAVQAIKMGALDYLTKDLENDYLKILPLRIKKIIKEKNIELELEKYKNTLEIMVKKRTLELETEIAQRITAEKKAYEMANKLQHSLEAKSKFLSHMSHEIRTPMNGIMGMTYLLNDTTLTVEQEEMLQIIQSSSDGLMRILNDILDSSKIEAGKIDLENEYFDIKNTLNELITIARNKSLKAHKTNIKISLICNKNIPTEILGDIVRVKQIISNILFNAVKFTKSGEINLTIKAQKIDKCNYIFIFDIQDTGIGISIENQAKLFTPFVQADSSIIKSYGGTGLGLSIALELANLMGGSIEVQSQIEIGSTFSISIPFAICQSEDCKKLIQETTRKNHIFSTRKAQHILLVEDNLVNQKVLSLTLKKMGHHCSLANDGVEGLKAIVEQDAQKFDLIFIDIQMPNMDGITLTKEIIKKLGAKRPTLIAMTANAFLAEKQRCLNAGMDDFISKPFRVDDLIKIIEKYQK